MAIEISCLVCGETERLRGDRRRHHIAIRCEACGQEWERPTTPGCATCEGADLQAVPLAIVEKSRGTQLSVVGIRIVHLCWECDREAIDCWQRSRPNPLMPDDLPHLPHEA